MALHSLDRIGELQLDLTDSNVNRVEHSQERDQVVTVDKGKCGADAGPLALNSDNGCFLGSRVDQDLDPRGSVGSRPAETSEDLNRQSDGVPKVNMLMHSVNKEVLRWNDKGDK